MEVETTVAPLTATTDATGDGTDQTAPGLRAGTPTDQATVETSTSEPATASSAYVYFLLMSQVY